jgi:archaellum component FlaG (FlaF/FlaG flagellin family)
MMQVYESGGAEIIRISLKCTAVMLLRSDGNRVTPILDGVCPECGVKFALNENAGSTLNPGETG